MTFNANMQVVKLKHETTVASLDAELQAVTAKYQELIRMAKITFLGKMSVDTKGKLLKQLDSTSGLVEFTQQGMNELWESVLKESEQRSGPIWKLETVAEKLTSDRAKEMKAILKKHAVILTDIGFLRPAVVCALVKSREEEQNNAFFQENTLVNLVNRLKTNEQQRLTDLRGCWEQKFQEWKTFKLQAALDKVKEVLQTDGLKATKKKLEEQQKSICDKRRAILQKFSSVVPPNFSKKLAADWRLSLYAANKEICVLYKESISKQWALCQTYSSKCSQAVLKFQEEAAFYAQKGVVRELVYKELQPLIRRRKTRMQRWLHSMEAFKSIANRVDTVSRNLGTLLIRVGEVWDEHCARLQDKQVELQNFALDHMMHMMKKEKDIQMDKLLAEISHLSTVQSIERLMDKIHGLMETTKKGYFSLYENGLVKADKFPASVLEELYNYSSAVSRLLGVDEIYHMDSEELWRFFPSFMDANITRKASEFRSADEVSLRLKDKSPRIEFTTFSGNVYHVQSIVEKAEKVTADLGPVNLPTKLLSEQHKAFCIAFFNHLEERYGTVLAETVSIVFKKKEELKLDLDLQLKFHESWAKGVETDIYDTRIADLKKHDAEIERHCSSIKQALRQLNTDFLSMKADEQLQLEEFEHNILTNESIFSSATTLTTVVFLQRRLNRRLDEKESAILGTHNNFREKAEMLLENLKDFNTERLKTLKTAQKGGEYTAREINCYRKSLTSVGIEVTKTCKMINMNVSINESLCLEKARLVVKKLTSKYLCITSDLEFLDKVQTILDNTRVQIEKEADVCKKQGDLLNTKLTELENMKNTLDGLNSDKNATVTCNLRSMEEALISELKLRCEYLECSVVPVEKVDRLSLHELVHNLVLSLEVQAEPTNQPLKEKDIKIKKPVMPKLVAKKHPVNLYSEKAPSCLERYHIFGSKLEIHTKMTYKEVITSILWKANDELMNMAEKYYQHRRLYFGGLPQHITQSLTELAKELNQKLLEFHSQSVETHKRSVRAFQQQVQKAEKQLSHMDSSSNSV